MKSIEELLQNLARVEVLEFGLVTNRLPSVNIGGKFEPVDDEAPTTDDLLQMLVMMGGGRHVDKLSEQAVQWTMRLEGVGLVAVAAIMRKDVVQARFTVVRRESVASSRPMVAAKEAPSAPAQSAPADLRRTQLGTGGPQPNQPSLAAGAATQSRPPSVGAQAVAAVAPSSSGLVAAAPLARPSTAPLGLTPTSTGSVAPPGSPGSAPRLSAAPALSSSGLEGAGATPDEWDNDDEPTVQTFSPSGAFPVMSPVGSPSGAPEGRSPTGPVQAVGPSVARPLGLPSVAPSALPEGAGPKPARRPPPLPGQLAAEERRVAEEREAAADERRAAEEREAAAAERKAAEERAAVEQATTDHGGPERAAAERKAAEERAAVEQAPTDHGGAERAAADRRAAFERAAADHAEEAAAEVAPRQRSERRIPTPTAVDAQTAAKDASRPATAAGASAAPEPEHVDKTVELSAPPRLHLDRATAVSLSEAATSAVPSTTPSAFSLDKERPRQPSALDGFLAVAVAAGATDLHVVAGRPLLVRVATDLLPRTAPLPAEQVERIARDIVPGHLRASLDAEGSCEFALEHPAHGRFRVQVSRQRTGFKLALRVLSGDVPTLSGLGVPEAVGSAARFGRGLVLFTGPAGHGKSSTLAAVVGVLNRETSRHILTLEDPIEFVHPKKRALVTQREVGAHARALAPAVLAASRQDADVIVIGELRDAASLRAALAASEAGALVLATLNTASVARTVDRILALFPASEHHEVQGRLASALRLLVGQRLVPSADRTRLHVAVELLPATIALYTLIREGRTAHIASLQQRVRALGALRLDESLAELVRAQKVTLEVAKHYAESPQDLEVHAARSVPPAAPRKA